MATTQAANAKSRGPDAEERQADDDHLATQIGCPQKAKKSENMQCRYGSHHSRHDEVSALCARGRHSDAPPRPRPDRAASPLAPRVRSVDRGPEGVAPGQVAWAGRAKTARRHRAGHLPELPSSTRSSWSSSRCRGAPAQEHASGMRATQSEPPTHGGSIPFQPAPNP